MTFNGILQIVLFFGVLLLTVKPFGSYMASVFTGERTFLSPLLRPVEVGLYKLFGVREDEEQKWTTYAFAVLTFSLVGMLLTYLLLRIQGMLPFNPQHFTGRQMPADLAFNTAGSFATNTNWQSYTPEATVSYFSNMVSLAVHNWMSAATGIAVAVALIRGFARRPSADQQKSAARAGKSAGIGSFWVDMTRATLYILLPICFFYALFLVWQGVPQNFHAYTAVKTIEGAAQSIGQGPVASQEAIKMLGTNGGGFFNANSAHPYENPTPLANFVQMVSMFVISGGLCYTFGKMMGNTRQGWALLAAMSTMFLVGVFVCYPAEQTGNPEMHALHVGTGAFNPGNFEGKETRFGIADSALFATVTTDTSCGAVNAMHDSFTPIGGLVPLFNIMVGELIFGGVGSGLYGILMYAIIAVFIAGLMVGRTPEYLGKKIEQYEVKMSMLAVLVGAVSILGFAALAANVNLPTDTTKSNLAVINRLPAPAYGGTSNTYEGATYNNVNNNAAHGLSEILYAYTSATGNNGSAFAGITANTPFFNLTLGMAMLIGRFLMMLPMLAIAGSVAGKKYIPMSAGTFPTDGGTFAGLLVGTVVIVGALTYLPALALGPIVENFQMLQGLKF